MRQLLFFYHDDAVLDTTYK